MDILHPPTPAPNARSEGQRRRHQQRQEAERANPLLRWWDRIKKFNRPPNVFTQQGHFAKRHNAGECDKPCPHCGALHWIDERMRNSSIRNPTFPKCCSNDRVQLPTLGGVDEVNHLDNAEQPGEPAQPRFRWLEGMLTEDSQYSVSLFSLSSFPPTVLFLDTIYRSYSKGFSRQHSAIQ